MPNRNVARWGKFKAPIYLGLPHIEMSSNRRANRAGRILGTIACSWQSIPFKSVQDVALSSCLKTFVAFKYSMLRVFNAKMWLKGFLWPQGSRDVYFCEDERHRITLHIILLAHCTCAGIVFFRKCFSLQYPVLLSWSHAIYRKWQYYSKRRSIGM